MVIGKKGTDLFLKYILRDYCEITVAGQEDNSYWTITAKAKKVTPNKIAEIRVKSFYDQELEILESERRNGRR